MARIFETILEAVIPPLPGVSTSRGDGAVPQQESGGARKRKPVGTGGDRRSAGNGSQTEIKLARHERA